MRERIEMNMSPMDVIAKMSEGNPGGLTVMMKIIENDPVCGVFDILHLDDMNIWGSQIWIGFKDYCNQDIDVFIEKIRARDPDMVKYINEESAREGINEHVVTAGASFSRR